MNDNDRALCAAMASWLRAARAIAHWGFALSCIAGLVLALTLRSLSLTSAMGFGAVAILGALERYFALRMQFDIGLFESLARVEIAALSPLDAALKRLGLRTASDTVRSLDDRLQGTRLLMQRHAIVVACQTAMFLLALLTQELR